jgi:hypothetical protein
MTTARWLAVLVLTSLGCAHGEPAPSPRNVEEAPMGEDEVAIRSLCGMELVVNDGDAHFAVDLTGASVHSDEKPEGLFIRVDDLVIQAVHVSEKQMGAAASGKRGLELLRAHRAWESDYISSTLGVKLEPHEMDLEIESTPGSRQHGLMWWVPLPDAPGSAHRYMVFASLEVSHHVVGLSARAWYGLEPLDVMARLASSMRTLKTSPAYLSPVAIASDIRKRSQAGESCPPSADPIPILGVDRRLRLDDVPEADRAEVIRIAEAQGGVERRNVNGRRRYINHVCRFDFDYPDDAWQDFAIQDFSAKGCMLNLATPPIFDPDDREKITNAVMLWATKAEGDFGRDQLQEVILSGVRRKGGRVASGQRPPLDGAAYATYTVESGGTHYTGEVLTVRRGAMLYNIHFNSTRGTVAEGRKHLLKLLAGLRLDSP